MIRDSPGIVLRLGGTSLHVRDEARAQRLNAILDVLDGRSSEAAIASVGLGYWRESIQILEELSDAGMLIESGRVAPDVGVKPPPALQPPPAAAVAVIGSGRVAERLCSALRGIGALLPERSASIRIVCADGPDLRTFEEFNILARAQQWLWMPAFKLADVLIVGPVVDGTRPGCFRCFERRWTGVAAAPRAEAAYFRALREGGWRREMISSSETEVLVHIAVTLASECGADAGASGRLAILDVQTNELNASRLTPHPDCELCADVWPKPDLSAMWAEWQVAGAGWRIEDWAERLLRVVDDRIGLVGRITALGQPAAQRVALHAKVARFAIPRVERIKSDGSNICGGLQPTDELATLVTIIEGLERYCGIFPRRPDLVAPYRDVATHAILPAELPLFSDAQYRQPGFPFRPFRPDEPLSWMWGYSLTRKTPRLVPKSAATYGPTDDQLLDECSSGVAAAFSVPDATLRGLLEMVERDAFMIFWLNRLSPPLIDPLSLPEGFARMAVAEIRAMGYDPFVANVTTDFGIPVVLGMAVHQEHIRHALVLGGGCAFDPRHALEKALREVLGAVQYHVMDTGWRLAPPMEPEHVKTLDDHHKAYSHHEWLPRAAFLWSSTTRQEFGDLEPAAQPSDCPGHQLAAAVEIMQRSGLEVVAVDLTTPDVAATGVRVVRAVIPGLQPIGFGPHGVRLGGSRVYRAPCSMGYRTSPAREHELNADPHCFP